MGIERKPPKPKACTICGETFTPSRMGQKACGVKCACQYGDRQRKRERATETRQMKRAQNSENRGHQMKLAQTACNTYIRARDQGKPCISCGSHFAGKFDAGHFRAVGSHPELRFDEENIHGQCVACNQHQSGNLIEYRKGLLDRIGEDRLARLEGPHPVNTLTLDEIKAITAKYKAMKKEIEQ